MVGSGICNIDKTDILKVVSEAEILNNYLGITEIPNTICSPIRTDRHPSFRIYSPDGIRVRYYDYATKESGGTFNLMQKVFNMNFPQTLGKIYNELAKLRTGQINVVKSQLTQDSQVTIHSSSTEYKVRSKQRAWETYDFDYWASYGVPKSWLLHSDIYPISHIIITSSTGFSQVVKADQYAYTFIERKDGITSEKIYQPFNQQGKKWRNSHDSSVWDLWTKLPPRGKKVIITSSRKDALCIWANTHIPSVSLQSEAAKINPKVMDELKSRFEDVYILYDNDFQNDVNNGRLDGADVANVFNVKQIEIPTEYQSKDISDLFHRFGATKVREVISALVNDNHK